MKMFELKQNLETDLHPDVEAFLAATGWDVRAGAVPGFIVIETQACPDADCHGELILDATDGTWRCIRCGAAGRLTDLESVKNEPDHSVEAGKEEGAASGAAEGSEPPTASDHEPRASDRRKGADPHAYVVLDAGDKVMTKIIRRREDGSLAVDGDIPHASWFDVLVIQLRNLDYVEVFLQELAYGDGEESRFPIPGVLTKLARRKLEAGERIHRWSSIQRHRKSEIMIQDGARGFLISDFDKVKIPDDIDVGKEPERAIEAAFAITFPKELREAAAVVQMSSSAGTRRGYVSGHVVFMLDHPMTLAEQEAALKKSWEPGLVWQYWVTGDDGKEKIHNVIDWSLFRPEQVIYTRAPVLSEGAEDPCPRRIIRRGGTPTVKLGGGETFRPIKPPRPKVTRRTDARVRKGGSIPDLIQDVCPRGGGDRRHEFVVRLTGLGVREGWSDAVFDELEASLPPRAIGPRPDEWREALEGARGVDPEKLSTWSKLAEIVGDEAARRIRASFASWAYSIDGDQEGNAEDTGTEGEREWTPRRGSAAWHDRRAIAAAVANPTPGPKYLSLEEIRAQLEPGTILVIKSPTGSAKTTITAEIVRGKSTQVVVPRRSLANAASRVYKLPTHLQIGTKHLGDVGRGVLSGGDVTCIDSLAKHSTDWIPEVLVLEEAGALFHHLFMGQTIPDFSSNGRSSRGEVFSHLQAVGKAVLESHGNIIALDAHAAHQLDDLFAEMFGADVKVKWLDIERPDERKVTWFENPGRFIDSIAETMAAGELAVVHCTSATKARALARYLRTLAPSGKRVLEYTAETPPVEREALRNVSDEWAAEDVAAVVCSPAVDTGVDFSPTNGRQAHVFLLGYRVPGIGWRDLMQMLGRVREPASRNVWIDTTHWIIAEPTYKAVRAERSRDRQLSRSGLTEASDPELPWAANDEAFAKCQFMVTAAARLDGRIPAACVRARLESLGTTIEDNVEESTTDYGKLLPALAKQIKTERAEKIMAARPITEEERRTRPEPRTEEEVHELERFRLANKFGPENITSELVRDDENKRICRTTGIRAIWAAIAAGDFSLALGREREIQRGGYGAALTGVGKKLQAIFRGLEAVGMRPAEFTNPPMVQGGWAGPPGAIDGQQSIPPGGPRNIPESLSTLTWPSDEAEGARLLALFRQGVEATGVDFDDLRSLGVRGRTWCEVIGRVLRLLGEKTRHTRPRKDRDRIRVYRLDMQHHELVVRRSAVTIARKFGAELHPTRPDWSPDKVRVAVDPKTGYWRRVPGYKQWSGRRRSRGRRSIVHEDIMRRIFGYDQAA